MRLRTAAASAALVLCFATAATACSPVEAADKEAVVTPTECATTAAGIPEDCAADVDTTEITEGEPAEGAPTAP
ncbi:hypothetical protein [Streptomyces sp. NPDC056600]|uniref:hypothetical protein n=1 Tax=Streptomyces sp. NPDC056600 TaxID=3345874 RepID=UPI003673A8DA